MGYNIGMDIKFEWDENKNQINIVRHGISFVEASTVFRDTNAIIEYDVGHSQDEDRFIIIGHSVMGNLLMVCHCERDGGVIRLISARKATKIERKQYFDDLM